MAICFLVVIIFFKYIRSTKTKKTKLFIDYLKNVYKIPKLESKSQICKFNKFNSKNLSLLIAANIVLDLDQHNTEAP